MALLVIIPKRYKSFDRCVDAILRTPERKLFQSELKKLVYPKSWRNVVKREIAFWNRTLAEECPGLHLISSTPARNLRTGRRNELLLSIDPRAELASKPACFVIRIQGGEMNDDGQR